MRRLLVLCGGGSAPFRLGAGSGMFSLSLPRSPLPPRPLPRSPLPPRPLPRSPLPPPLGRPGSVAGSLPSTAPFDAETLRPVLVCPLSSSWPPRTACQRPASGPERLAKPPSRCSTRAKTLDQLPRRPRTCSRGQQICQECCCTHHTRAKYM